MSARHNARKKALWRRFVVEKRVDVVTALRYLKAMDDRHEGLPAIAQLPRE
jgi:hypothetical protein